MVQEAIAQQDKRAANIRFLSFKFESWRWISGKNMAFIMP
jgi:hypothetical protein